MLWRALDAVLGRVRCVVPFISRMLKFFSFASYEIRVCEIHFRQPPLRDTYETPLKIVRVLCTHVSVYRYRWRACTRHVGKNCLDVTRHDQPVPDPYLLTSMTN